MQGQVEGERGGEGMEEETKESSASLLLDGRTPLQGTCSEVRF